MKKKFILLCALLSSCSIELGGSSLSYSLLSEESQSVISSKDEEIENLQSSLNEESSVSSNILKIYLLM